jgi:hypothetical protein
VMAASLARVQFQMTEPVPHRVRRCCKECVLPHKLHRSVSARRMEARRSFVGIISCIATYHADFNGSGIQALCRFVQTLFHGLVGCFLMMRIVAVSLPASASSRSIPYIRFLNLYMISLLAGGVIYAISKA